MNAVIKQKKEKKEKLEISKDSKICSVVKYKYRGVPEEYIGDNKGKKVRMRKKKMEVQKDLEINRGCTVFRERIRKAEMNMSMPQAEVVGEGRIGRRVGSPEYNYESMEVGRSRPHT